MTHLQVNSLSLVSLLSKHEINLLLSFKKQFLNIAIVLLPQEIRINYDKEFFNTSICFNSLVGFVLFQRK